MNEAYADWQQYSASKVHELAGKLEFGKVTAEQAPEDISISPISMADLNIRYFT